MDRRTIKTKAAIRDAYFSLLLNDSTGTISIAQIAREANIDRKTFYLHYDSIDAIIHEYILEQSDHLFNYLIENSYFENPLSIDLLFSALESSMTTNIKLAKKILNSPYARVFWEDIVDIVVNTSKEIYGDQISCSMKDFEFCARFYAQGYVATYQDYLCGRTDKDIKHILELVSSITRAGISQFIVKQDA